MQKLGVHLAWKWFEISLQLQVLIIAEVDINYNGEK